MVGDPKTTHSPRRTTINGTGTSLTKQCGCKEQCQVTTHLAITIPALLLSLLTEPCDSGVSSYIVKVLKETAVFSNRNSFSIVQYYKLSTLNTVVPTFSALWTSSGRGGEEMVAYARHLRKWSFTRSCAYLLLAQPSSQQTTNQYRTVDWGLGTPALILPSLAG